MAAVVYISFGTMKLFGFPPPPVALPPITPMSRPWIAGVLETFGGSPQSVYPSTNMGTPAILYCFFWLYLVFAGPGAWSLDSVIARSKGGSVS
jgi:putative oxidoreductase